MTHSLETLLHTHTIKIINLKYPKQIMEKPAYYSIIPASVRYDKNLCANAKLMYGEITALCNQEGYCWASNTYFTELYGMKRTATISEWLKALKDSGNITVEFDGENGEGRKIYLSNPIRKNVTPHTEKRNPPHTEKRIHNNKEFNTKEDTIISLPLYINPQVWDEWVQHRKELKKPLTPSTIKKQIAQLGEFHSLGMDTTEVINISIAGGYAGLFRLRNGKQYEPQKSKVSTTMSNYEAICAERAGKQNAIDGELV